MEHVPAGCGTWPAFWLVGPEWPTHGEIDIIEGVNMQTDVISTLHTNEGCTQAGDNAVHPSPTTRPCANIPNESRTRRQTQLGLLLCSRARARVNDVIACRPGWTNQSSLGRQLRRTATSMHQARHRLGVLPRPKSDQRSSAPLLAQRSLLGSEVPDPEELLVAVLTPYVCFGRSEHVAFFVDGPDKAPRRSPRIDRSVVLSRFSTPVSRRDNPHG